MPDTARPRNPFKALRPYTSEDRDTFFGRDSDLSLILDRVLSNRTTLLFAGSGVGKTSFLNAKVIPELEGSHFICYHGLWAEQEPLRSVRTTVANALNAGADTGGDERSLLDVYKQHAPARSMLVLDQFEEVFQYHRDTDYFEAFLSGLSELITAPGPDVRVVFAMREEFLGELSVFDNRIPDLFNNYYRLKSPTGKQAREIIRLTCESVGVTCDSSGLSEFLDDLLSADIGRAYPLPSRRATHGSSNQRKRRDYVPPPYLQIACYRLWEAHASSAETAGGNDHFLAGYEPGAAALELNAYCHEKLAALPTVQQDMAADAFSYLMTKQGAKMAYELAHLAEHMRAAEPILRDTLNALSDPQVRILRRSTGPDGGIWFELYHDMYAPFISRWKSSFESDRRDRLALEEMARREEAVNARLAGVRVRRIWIISTLASLVLIGFPLGALMIVVFLRVDKPPLTWPRALGVGLAWIASWLAAVVGIVVFGQVVIGGVFEPAYDSSSRATVLIQAVFLAILSGLSGAGGAILLWLRLIRPRHVRDASLRPRHEVGSSARC